jgi:hypothetical protein
MSNIIRLTLFPPSGPRITQTVQTYGIQNGHILHYRDGDGIDYETSLPFAVEHIKEEHAKAPFEEARETAIRERLERARERVNEA